MKAMTCRQLGGACDQIFEADTWEEMVSLSKQHGTEMFQIKESAHMVAIGKMQEMMKSPEQMQKWFAAKKAAFEALPNS